MATPPRVVRPCTDEDIQRLVAAAMDPRYLRRHEDRFAIQRAGEGWHLLAWEGERFVGQVTVTTESKYEAVRSRHGRFPEMNALEANTQGRGIGTMLIDAAERLAHSAGATKIGLAVERYNARARRLYDRLGYRDWGRGTVVDEWAERDVDGNVLALHRDECSYLVRSLAAR